MAKLLNWFELHMFLKNWKFNNNKIDGLVQDCSISIANTLELLEFCFKPLR